MLLYPWLVFNIEDFCFYGQRPSIGGSQAQLEFGHPRHSGQSIMGQRHYIPLNAQTIREQGFLPDPTVFKCCLLLIAVYIPPFWKISPPFKLCSCWPWGSLSVRGWGSGVEHLLLILMVPALVLSIFSYKDQFVGDVKDLAESLPVKTSGLTQCRRALLLMSRGSLWPKRPALWSQLWHQA